MHASAVLAHINGCVCVTLAGCWSYVLSQVIEAGANALVAGNAVFKAKSYKDGECSVLC